VRGGSDTSRSEPSVAMLRRFGKMSPAAITIAVGERNHAWRFQRALDVLLLALRGVWRGGMRVHGSFAP
jgi:hypothetical protein